MTAKNPEARLSRRKFMKIAALLATAIAITPLAACTPPPSDSSPRPEAPTQPQRTTQEILIDAITGKQPTEKELARLATQLAGNDTNQLAGIIIDLVRLYPSINHQELLTHLQLEPGELATNIQQLLELLIDQVNLFPENYPFDHRLAHAEKMAKEKGTGLNEYLAEQLFLRLEPMIARFPSLISLIPPGQFSWEFCKELRRIPQQIYPQVLMAFHYFVEWQKTASFWPRGDKPYQYVIDGFVDEILPLYFDGDVPKEHERNYQTNLALAQNQLLAALYPMVPESFVLLNNQERLSNRNDVVSLFANQLTDLCLYLLAKSTENQAIRNKLLPLLRAVQAEVSPNRIISQQELEQMLDSLQHNSQFEDLLRQAVQKAIASVGTNAQADLEKQFKPITKPKQIISFEGEKNIIIPEEALPANEDFDTCAHLYLPIHHQNPDGAINDVPIGSSEFVPLLSTRGQYFSNDAVLEKGLNFFLLDDGRVAAVPQQALSLFKEKFSSATLLRIKKITYRDRGGAGAAIRNVEKTIAEAKTDFLGEIGLNNNPENLDNQRLIGTFAVCELPAENNINHANPINHPANSIIWITITQGGNQYYAYSENFGQNTTYTAAYSAGKVDVQHQNSVGGLVTKTYKFLSNDPNPGFFDATMTPMAQALGKEFLTQMQSSSVNKQVLAFLRMAALTSRTGGLNNKNYVAKPISNATVYLVSYGENQNDNQQVLGTTSDSLPLLAGNLRLEPHIATETQPARFCVVLGEIRDGGLGRGSKPVKLLVPQEEVEVVEIPQPDHPLAHKSWSQLHVAALYGLTEKLVNTGKFDLGIGLYYALVELIGLNSGINSD